MKYLITTIAAVMLVGCGPAVPDISIHGAAATGNIKAVKRHFEAGMDLNAKEDVWGATPLHMAAANGNKKIAEFLITKGADVNAKKNEEEIPLHLAALNGHMAIAELLIAAGAD